MGSISLRKFIRWLPDEPSEPTSTIVVTSPGRYFVDIRILLSEASTKADDFIGEEISLDRLDWGLAGTSISSLVEGGPVTRGQWHRWIDSHSEDTENAVDEGVNHPQADGTVLEKGVMVNPATGVDGEYEELWHDLTVLPTDSDKLRVVVLQYEEDNRNRGLVVRVGQYCQGLMREGEKITAERWKWAENRKWTKEAFIGNGALPCHLALDGDRIDTLHQGNSFKFQDKSWKVIEFVEL